MPLRRSKVSAACAPVRRFTERTWLYWAKVDFTLKLAHSESSNAGADRSKNSGSKNGMSHNIRSAVCAAREENLRPAPILPLTKPIQTVQRRHPVGLGHGGVV